MDFRKMDQSKGNVFRGTSKVEDKGRKGEITTLAATLIVVPLRCMMARANQVSQYRRPNRRRMHCSCRAACLLIACLVAACLDACRLTACLVACLLLEESQGFIQVIPRPLQPVLHIVEIEVGHQQ